MKTLNWMIAVLMLVISFGAAAKDEPEAPVVLEECTSTAENSIVLNADGDYVITYNGCVTIWEPATKIDPQVTGHTAYNPKTETVSYNYQIHSGPKSRQPIAVVRLYGSNASFNARTPSDWRGEGQGFLIPGHGFNVGFHSWSGPEGDRRKGVQPGAMMDGIGFDNTDLPGVGNIDIHGGVQKQNNFTAGWRAVPDPYDNGVGKQFAEIQSKNFVSRLAPIPMIPVASPFNAAAVLTAIQQHLNKDLTELGLVQPALAGQLDSLFQKAINSAKGNNLAGVRDTIRELQTLIERAQGGKTKTIDPLAVQVLVFDLKVVDQRLGN